MESRFQKRLQKTTITSQKRLSGTKMGPSKACSNCSLQTKQLFIRESVLVVASQSVFILGHSAWMIQIAAVTITTHQCLIVCNAEITLLIVTLKSMSVCVCVWVCEFCMSVWQIETEGKMEERGTIGVFIRNTFKCIYITPFPLIILLLQTSSESNCYLWSGSARQSCFITIWFILPTGTTIRRLIVLPSPQIADYRRHNMKHSAEIGNCFFSVNKSIRCTVPGIKHIFQGYGPIFCFRAAGSVTKWSSFGCENQTRTLYFHKFRLQKHEVVIITNVLSKYGANWILSL